jgi:hypothetical protein
MSESAATGTSQAPQNTSNTTQGNEGNPQARPGSPRPTPAPSAKGKHDERGMPLEDRPDAQSVETDEQRAQKEAEKRAAERKWKLKIGGEEREYDLDNPEHADHIRRYAQKAAGADKAFEEAAKLRRETESILKAAKDPQSFWEVAKSLGHDPKEMATKLLREVIEEEAMDPRERHIKQLQMQLAQKEAMERQIQEQQRRAQLEQAKEQYRGKWDQEISKALQSSALPKTDYTVEKMARYLIAAIKQEKETGYRPEMKDIVQLVKSDYQRDFQAFVGMPVENVLEYLGPEMTKRLQEHEVKKYQDPHHFVKKPQKEVEAVKTKERPSYTWDEYQEILANRVKS